MSEIDQTGLSDFIDSVTNKLSDAIGIPVENILTKEKQRYIQFSGRTIRQPIHPIDPEEDIPLSQFEAAMMEPCDNSIMVLYQLKEELKVTINRMVQHKPRDWQVKKTAYAEVLKIIKTLESEK